MATHAWAFRNGAESEHAAGSSRAPAAALRRNALAGWQLDESIPLSSILLFTIPTRLIPAVGVADNVNCYPFTCNDSGRSTGQSIKYQQLYTAGSLTGLTSFNTLKFYDTFTTDATTGFGLPGAPFWAARTTSPSITRRWHRALLGRPQPGMREH